MCVQLMSFDHRGSGSRSSPLSRSLWLAKCGDAEGTAGSMLDGVHTLSDGDVLERPSIGGATSDSDDAEWIASP